MKKTIVLVAHPNIQESTVNRYWADALVGKVTLRFLEEVASLDRPIDIASEQAVLEQFDRIVFQFPLYWYGAPALLKRWFDEVLTFGWAYGTECKLKGKEIGVAVSCGADENSFTKESFPFRTLAEYMSPFEGIASFIQAKWIGLHAFYDTYGTNLKERLKANTQDYLAFLEK